MCCSIFCFLFFFKQKTAYEMRISDWSSDVCSSDLWVDDLGRLLGRPLALGLITFIAYVPGFMNAFLISTILLDRRPVRRVPMHYPSVTVLVACYNEGGNIEHTIDSLAQQGYPGAMTVLVLDDGSTDDSVERAQAAIDGAVLRPGHAIRLVRGERNVGKAGVLNRGLAMTHDDIVVTIDGDSWVYRDALAKLVERYLADPPGTRAVAGSVLVRNSRRNWLTRVQEWDYFHGIAAVQRMQSMYHGTLDRKSVAWGRSVSVRVDLGGRRIVNTKTNVDSVIPDMQMYEQTSLANW